MPKNCGSESEVIVASSITNSTQNFPIITGAPVSRFKAVDDDQGENVGVTCYIVGRIRICDGAGLNASSTCIS